MKCQEFWYLVIFFGLGLKQPVVLGTYEEDSWVDPDVWSREKLAQNVGQIDANEFRKEEPAPDFQCNTLKEATDKGEALALLYYKRLIAYLFKSEFFKPNEFNGLLSRALVLNALPEQLKQLQNLDDPRDLDNILSGIFINARVPSLDDCYSLYGENAQRGRMGFFALIWDIIKDFGKLLKISEVQFLLGVAFLLLLGWHCHRKYQIGIITMIIGGVVCFGYFHTYLECNRKLEAERMLEILSRSEKQKPVEPSWFTPIINFFTSSEQNAKISQQEYIKKSSRLNLNFCRPDHVFLLYANDLFLTQLQFLIDKCQETMLSLKANLPIPLNYFAPFFLVCLIAYIIKLTFKYILSPRAWMGVWHSQSSQAPQLSMPPINSGTTHHEDRISGENLRMLLNAISGNANAANQITISNTTATASLTSQTPALGSGVEEITAALENGSADTVSDTSISEVAEGDAKSTPQKEIETLNNNGITEKQTDVSNDKSHNKSIDLKVEDVLNERT